VERLRPRPDSRRLARLVGVACLLACGSLLAPAAASAVTCDRVGLALIVNMDGNDLAGLTVSNGTIQVRDTGNLVTCSGATPTVTTIGAILVSNPPGATIASVNIEDAGDFAPGAPSTQEPGDAPGTGTPEIEIAVNLHNAGFSVLSVRDRGGYVRFGQNGVNPNATPGEVNPDVDINPIGVRTLEGRGGTAGNIVDPSVLGAQGGAGTGAPLTDGIELLGNGGNDQLTGGNGKDQLLAFGGDDSLMGLDGDDTLQPGAGTDFASGGAGVDKLDYLLNQNIPSVELDLTLTSPQDTGGAGTETISDIENVDGTAGPDILRGDDGPNELFASNGDDIIEGRGAKDVLMGWRGADRINARDGEEDTVDCGDDDDKVVTDRPGLDTLIDCEDVSFAAANGGGGGGGGGGGAGGNVKTFGRKTRVSLGLTAARIPAKGPLALRIANRNDFRVVARVSGQTVAKVQAAAKRRLKLGTKRVTVGAKAARTVKLSLPKALRRLIAHKGKVALRLSVRLTDPIGNVRTFTKRLTPRLKRG
jgi:Ca2+-binding RTX toxin-like protein